VWQFVRNIAFFIGATGLEGDTENSELSQAARLLNGDIIRGLSPIIASQSYLPTIHILKFL